MFIRDSVLVVEKCAHLHYWHVYGNGNVQVTSLRDVVDY
jgi:hypothetical protein